MEDEALRSIEMELVYKTFQCFVKKISNLNIVCGDVIKNLRVCFEHNDTRSIKKILSFYNEAMRKGGWGTETHSQGDWL